LEAHDPRLAALPRVLALSKADLVPELERGAAQARWRERLGPEVPVIVTSSVTGLGLHELASELVRRVPVLHVREPAAAGGRGAPAGAGGPGAPAGAGSPGGPAGAGGRGAPAGLGGPGTPVEARADLAEHQIFRPAADRAYRVKRTGERSYKVSGKGIERLVARYDHDNEDALSHLERRLRGIGVIRALEDEGFEPGDEVEIAGVLFDLDPDV
ncbi:MAG TPA: Obg family GTPase CgtA, partial [Candidatus Bathyarchaeia archaeon]|nr:Obg family GTPase CgtA [Candidatus Bathyarchaeia archaeon]